MTSHASKPRNDLAPAHRDQLAIKGQPFRMTAMLGIVPAKLGRKECLFGRGIGYARRLFGIAELGKLGEFRPASFPDDASEFRSEVAEERKGLGGRPFFAHEHHRYLRHEQIDRRDGAHRCGGCDHRQTLRKGAISYLIMVLNERDESGRRQTGARLAARLPAIMHDLTLKGEALGESTSELADVARIFAVIS